MQETALANWLVSQMGQPGKFGRRAISMRQVAEYTGLSHVTIHNIIKGVYRPSSETCIKLADYFKSDPDMVLELAGHRRGMCKSEDANEFLAYVSRRFKSHPRLQRALIQVYEAFRDIENAS